MTLLQSYVARPIKRIRATKSEVEARREALYEIVAEGRPMTVRQVFYQASVRNIVEKSEAGYTKVQTDLVQMRKAGTMPYGWLADGTRWQRRPTTFGDPQEALEDTANFYRKRLWDDVEDYVEIWLEKDALSGVIYPITSKYDVPLMVARGYASLSFLHSAAEAMNEMLGKSIYVYHLGDFDPSGVNAGEKIEQTLKELAPEADIIFERIAITPWQIENLNLPSRPTKTTDTRSKGFGNISVELDAMQPSSLRWLVETAIQNHLPEEKFKILKEAEASERRLIKGLVGMALDQGGRS